MGTKTTFDAARSTARAQALPLAPFQYYLDTIPQEQFPERFRQVRQRLAQAGAGGTSETLCLPSRHKGGKTGDGIYIEGDRVTLKNMVNAGGSQASTGFFIDDVGAIVHHSQVFILFLVLFISLKNSNTIVLFDKEMNILVTISPHQGGAYELLSHLVLAKPEIMVEKRIFRFISGEKRVFGKRVFGQLLLAIFGNVMLYLTVLGGIWLFS